MTIPSDRLSYQDTNIFQAARDWVRAGISVIPLRPRDKRPALWEWEPYKTRLPRPDELRAWFRGERNYGIISGWRSLAVLDFDNLGVYATWRAEHDIQTFEVATARGVHLYFFLAEPSRIYHGSGFDLIAGGGYVLGPGSVHPSGAVYQVISPAPIAHVATLADILPADVAVPAARSPVHQPVVMPEPEPVRDPWQAVNQNQALDVITKIKRQVKILDFFPDAISKGADGRWWVARCPFHDDHNPSFWIDTYRGLCGCYAGCTDRSLDVINLYARMANTTDREAIRNLSVLV